MFSDFLTTYARHVIFSCSDFVVCFLFSCEYLFFFFVFLLGVGAGG